MKIKTLEWVGGPDDGQYLTVPEEVTEIRIVVRQLPVWVEGELPSSYVPTDTRICPVEGNKVYWHGLPDTPRPNGSGLL